MASLLLLALLCLALAGFACAAAWSSSDQAHARRWDAAFALIVGLAASELVLLASPLALMLPLPALLGLPLPMLVGPFFWRSRDQRHSWTWRRWLLQLVPGLALLVSGLLTFGGLPAGLSWNTTELPSVALVIAAAVLNLMAGALSTRRSGRRHLQLRWH